MKDSDVFGDSGLSGALNAAALILVAVAAVVWITHFVVARDSVAMRIAWVAALVLALLAEIASRIVARPSRADGRRPRET